ncbi:unnamed protein product [Dovyalis caffra]|uniref:BTB domain-containing protein n=1 Tax=Dovyalis caffra TaxID=77055 RepID=A0AAV1RV27_9ROSI|nr:unnamed protein product [Dovyalis caffra]
MAEIRLTRVEQGHTKVRNVPIAVTPEGFWCCPSPVVFQRTIKTQNPLNKTKPSSPPPKTTVQKKQAPFNERKPPPSPLRSSVVSGDQRTCGSDTPGVSASIVSERTPRPKIESLPRKVAIEFGEPGTSDMKVVLLGKQGFCVKLSVHKNVLVENSRFFADKLSEEESNLSCLEIDDCEDVEIYVETVGLMYCKEMKQRLVKQSVSRVLRILKVAELLSFNTCIQSCLEYLEAVPWVGEEEEEKVVSSVIRLQNEGIGVTPVLKRVSSNVANPPKDTISHIVELVLKSNEERGRREMKSIVLKLLRENNSLPSYAAAEPGFADKPLDNKEPVVKQIVLEADNLSWLLEILADRQAADEFALMWASQQELASLHVELPIVSRYHEGSGGGDREDDSHSTPGEPAEHFACLVGNFLKAGDNCPNLQRAFEVWWRRTFIRPYMETQGNPQQSDSSMISKQET